MKTIIKLLLTGDGAVPPIVDYEHYHFPGIYILFD